MPSFACADQARKSSDNTLRMAIFPAATAAVEKLKETFKNDPTSIDIDFELWDSYSDTADDRGHEEIDRFDLIEVDACRLPKLLAGKFGTGGDSDILPFGTAEAEGRLQGSRQS